MVDKKFKENFSKYLDNKVENIPSRTNYYFLLEDFSDRLSKINKNIGFYVYGSVKRRNFVSGRSDIDGLVVMDDKFIIDKKDLMKVSRAYNESIKKYGKGIDIQLSVLDKGISMDGRFSSYPKKYADFFKSDSLYDMQNKNNSLEINGFDYKNSELGSISHNIGKVRQGFLTLENKIENNEFKDVNKILKSPLKKISQLPKQLMGLVMGEIFLERHDAMKEYSNLFPNYDMKILEKVDNLFNNAISYNKFGKDFKRDLEFSLDCLTGIEKMIKLYIEKFPVNRREIRD